MAVVFIFSSWIHWLPCVFCQGSPYILVNTNYLFFLICATLLGPNGQNYARRWAQRCALIHAFHPFPLSCSFHSIPTRPLDNSSLQCLIYSLHIPFCPNEQMYIYVLISPSFGLTGYPTLLLIYFGTLLSFTLKYILDTTVCWFGKVFFILFYSCIILSTVWIHHSLFDYSLMYGHSIFCVFKQCSNEQHCACYLYCCLQNNFLKQD